MYTCTENVEADGCLVVNLRLRARKKYIHISFQNRKFSLRISVVCYSLSPLLTSMKSRLEERYQEIQAMVSWFLRLLGWTEHCFKLIVKSGSVGVAHSIIIPTNCFVIESFCSSVKWLSTKLEDLFYKTRQDLTDSGNLTFNKYNNQHERTKRSSLSTAVFN